MGEEQARQQRVGHPACVRPFCLRRLLRALVLQALLLQAWGRRLRRLLQIRVLRALLQQRQAWQRLEQRCCDDRLTWPWDATLLGSTPQQHQQQ